MTDREVKVRCNKQESVVVHYSVGIIMSGVFFVLWKCETLGCIIVDAICIRRFGKCNLRFTVKSKHAEKPDTR